MECNPQNESEINTQSNVELTILSAEGNLTDCNVIERLPENASKAKQISFKRDGGKYFPHFKAKVISHALEHSIKNAALTFKVNRDTVSGWIHQSKASLLVETKKSKIIGSFCEEKSGPDYKFIQWLRSLRKNNCFSRELLIEKVNELLQSYGEQEPNKMNLWFFLYARRLKDNESGDKIIIKYPYKFKQEVVNFTNNFSKKKLSQIFKIDRKRICEWTNDFKNAELKKRDVSKYVTDPLVDCKIWEWYCLQENKPTSKEVRMKAAHLYEEAGFSKIRCSPGWYYRWRARHHLPPVRMSQAYRDSELLSWFLMQMDENKAISHSDLLKQASLFKGSDFKASSSWVFRFTKRYLSHIQSGSEKIILPGKLSDMAAGFKNYVSEFILTNNIQYTNIMAFDEIPLNFNYSETNRNESIVGKSDWANCQATVILSCLADGHLLPSGLIMIDSFENSNMDSNEINPVLLQKSGINDKDTIEKWFGVIKSKLKCPSILICDIYEPHRHLKTTYSEELSKRNIELMLIPGGCSSHLQPLLFGISQKFKLEVDNYFKNWLHESRLSGMATIRQPTNNDIYNWVQKAHNTLSFYCQDLIKLSFVKTGITSQF